MSSELHKKIEATNGKTQNLFNAEVLNFPKEKKEIFSKTISQKTNDFWNIKDSSNSDQFKAVTGICLMIGALIVIGLLANLSSI